MIRRNMACTTTTKFITLLNSAKKVRILAPPQLAAATHVVAPKTNATKAKEKKTGSVLTPPTWGEQADGYKATRRNLTSFNK